MMRQPKSRRGRPRSWHCGMLVAGAVVLALTAAACTSTAQSSSGSTPVKGGTAVFALAPSTVPNYIFPYISANQQSIANGQAGDDGFGYLGVQATRAQVVEEE